MSKKSDLHNESVYYEQLSPSLQRRIESSETFVQQILQAAQGPQSRTVVVVDYVVTELSVLPTGTQRIDGAKRSAGRVLVVNQTDRTRNGIYEIAAAGSWVRASVTLFPGMIVVVRSGARYADSVWVMSEPDTEDVVIGDKISFVELSATAMRASVWSAIAALNATIKKRIARAADAVMCKLCELQEANADVVFTAYGISGIWSVLNGVEALVPWATIEGSNKHVSYSLGVFTITQPGMYFVDVKFWDMYAQPSSTFKLYVECASDYPAVPQRCIDENTNTFVDLHGSRIIPIVAGANTFAIKFSHSNGSALTFNNGVGSPVRYWLRVFRVGTIENNL